MKRTFIILAVALLTACSGKECLFDSWKPWVAVNSGVTELIETDYESDWYGRMAGDPSSLFYENETMVMNMSNGSCPEFLTSNLWPVGMRIYTALTEMVREEYVKCINDGSKPDNDIIVSTVVDRFLASDIQKSSDGVYCLDLKISKDELNEEEISELKINNQSDTVSLRYEMDWLFKSERMLSTLVGDINGMCGTFDDFCCFLNNSVTVVKSGKDKNLSNLYNVIYHIDTDKVSTYSLCRIFEKGDGKSELELVRSSASLSDLD